MSLNDLLLQSLDDGDDMNLIDVDLEAHDDEERHAVSNADLGDGGEGGEEEEEEEGDDDEESEASSDDGSFEDEDEGGNTYIDD